MKVESKQANGRPRKTRSRLAALASGLLAVASSLPGAAVEITQSPLYLGSNVPGNLVLVPSVEYPTIISQANIGAYDATRAYMGYFDSAKCYEYVYADDEAARHFRPVGAASGNNHACSASGQWSGNYLSWALTQTIDPFRLVLTGGYRVRDTAAETWVEKARHDRDSLYPDRTISSGVGSATPAFWGSLRVRVRGLGNRIRVGPSEAAVNESTIAYDPRVHELRNDENGAAGIWDSGANQWLQQKSVELSARVKVCDASVGVESHCRQYGQNWKPEGLIQEYSNRLRYSIFGYLNDSSWSRDGGVLRARQKFVGPQTHYPDQDVAANAAAEWDAATGVLVDNPDTADASASSVGFSGVINYLNRFGQMTEAQHKSLDPVSELYYAALRYLKNLGNVPEYTNNASDTHKDGFPVITQWDDPISYQCQANVVLGIGDVYTHRDKNLPGTTPADGEPAKPSLITADTSVDVVAATAKVAELEGIDIDTPFALRPGQHHSAYIAGLAYDAHTRDIRPEMDGRQTVSTYWVDVRENQRLEPRSLNQYWLATKYGGFRVPDSFGDPYERTEPLDPSWWHRSGDYLNAGANGGTTRAVTDYPRPDNFYVAGEADKMIQGLRSAFESIVEEAVGSSGSFAANTTKLEAGAMTYQAQFYSGTWRGDLLAYRVNPETERLEEAAAWSASSLLDARPWSPDATINKRKIRYNDAGTDREFRGNLSAAYPGLTEAVVDYLRGDRSREGTVGFRTRQSVLGDIVNSQPVYVGRPIPNLYYGASFNGASTYGAFANAQASRTPVVYVGANDGMLHGFDARDTAGGGSETYAFIPAASLTVQGGQSRLARYAAEDYGSQTNPHQYFVDGEITAADVYVGGQWKTVLVGTMGRGGRSVYALDVTNPADVRFLWERSATNIPALGNVLGRPIIAQVANGDWRVLLGNGPNGVGGAAQLVSIRISDGVSSTVNLGGSYNGLSGVNAWSTGATEFVDTVYAGDLHGSLWKITNIASGTATALELFEAGYSGNSGGQPITATPAVSVNPNTGDTWVFFGTGRYLNLSDLTNDDVQSWYGIKDNNVALDRDDLDHVSITGEFDIPERPGFRARIIEENETLDGAGWVIDLLSSGTTAEGERMVLPNFFQGMTLVGTTRIPDSSDVCNPSGRGFVMAINPFTGGRLAQSFFDLNGDGVFDENDLVDGQPVSGVGLPSGPSNPIFVGNLMLVNMDNAESEELGTNSAALAPVRISWRELLLD